MKKYDIYYETKEIVLRCCYQMFEDYFYSAKTEHTQIYFYYWIDKGLSVIQWNLFI